MTKQEINSYYFSFTETGNYDIDNILRAIVDSAKAYHHTEQWQNEGCIHKIQEVADFAAMKLKSLDSQVNSQNEIT